MTLATDAGGEAQAPVADWITLDRLVEDPLSVVADLRRAGHETVFVPQFGRYLTIGFPECRAIESDDAHFGPLGENNLVRRALGSNMMTKGDPEHAVERQAMNPAVRPKAVEDRWLPMFRASAEALIDAMVDDGPGTDLVANFAVPYAASNLGSVLGLKGVPWTDIHRWSHSLIAAGGNLADDAAVWRSSRDANAEADRAIDANVRRVRRAPDDTILSALVNSPADLPLAAVRSDVKLIISGGMNEPQHTIANGVWAFDRHPEQKRRLIEDPTLFSMAFEEVVRWLSPIQSIPRLTMSEATVGGVRFEPGDEVMMLIGGANRDPREFEAPNDFNIFRPRRTHLAFGAGIHLCAGIWVSRLSIARVAWPLLYERLPGLRPVAPDAARWRGFNFRGLDHLPVTWDL